MNRVAFRLVVVPPKISDNHPPVIVGPIYVRTGEGWRSMEDRGGVETIAGRCDGIGLMKPAGVEVVKTRRISAILAEAARKLDAVRCQAYPGRSGTARSVEAEG